jgi:hypothetical protein
MNTSIKSYQESGICDDCRKQKQQKVCPRLHFLENRRMAKTDYLAIVRKLLRTDLPLDFLLRLDEDDFKTLIVCIREMKSQERQVH